MNEHTREREHPVLIQEFLVRASDDVYWVEAHLVDGAVLTRRLPYTCRVTADMCRLTCERMYAGAFSYASFLVMDGGWIQTAGWVAQ